MSYIGNPVLPTQVVSQGMFYGNSSSISGTVNLNNGLNNISSGPITMTSGIMTIQPGTTWKVF